MNRPDDARFRATLGHYLTGVTVVAAHTDQGPTGFTCQSFASLSLDPPHKPVESNELKHDVELIRGIVPIEGEFMLVKK